MGKSASHAPELIACTPHGEVEPCVFCISLSDLAEAEALERRGAKAAATRLHAAVQARLSVRFAWPVVPIHQPGT